MLRIVLMSAMMAGTALAAPKIGEDYGKLGPSGAEQAPVFKLTSEFQADFDKAEKCPLPDPDGDPVFVGKRAVYASGKQGVVVLQDELARRYAINYCWK